MTWLEHRIPPPIVMVMVGVGMWGLSLLGPALAVDALVRFPLAAITAGAGLLIIGLGVGAFGRAKTTINPLNIDAASSLVTSGVFAYTRNPMYLGMVLVLCGWAIALGAPVTLIGPAAFALFITRFQIMPEETVMAAKFGQAFADYSRRVRRWL